MPQTHRTVPVSTRALVQRINRKLKAEGRALRTPRGGRARKSLGYHYILDVNRNAVVAHWCDLEKLGRDMGVLEAFESLSHEE
jgi:hypothetical protein